jgi:1-acyl-sn-glycerol-3-phosphate acyltransferase
MGTLLCLLCFFLSTIGWDIASKFSYLIFRKNYTQFWNKFFKMMSHKSVFLAQVYAGLIFKKEKGIEGELPKRFIVVTNHQSLADIVILVCSFPDHDLKFTAKKELKYGIPAVSVGLRKGQHAFVQRKGSFKEGQRELKKLALAKGEHICPLVFVEGTRSRTGKLGKFHSAGMRVLLENSSLPIVSVAVDGGYKIATLKELFTKLKGLIYRVKILKVYPHVTGKSEIQNLLDDIHNDIDSQLKKWRSLEE